MKYSNYNMVIHVKRGYFIMSDGITNKRTLLNNELRINITNPVTIYNCKNLILIYSLFKFRVKLFIKMLFLYLELNIFFKTIKNIKKRR